MLLRQLTTADAEAYQTLRLFSLQDSPESFSSSFEEEQGRTLEHVANTITSSSERVSFGVFVDKSLVGMIRTGREASQKKRHCAFVRSLYVAPQARRLGIGRSLLSAAIDQATSWLGVEQVTLVATSSNAAAIGLYRKLGFIDYGVAPRALCINNQYYDEVHMVHHLNCVAPK